MPVRSGVSGVGTRTLRVYGSYACSGLSGSAARAVLRFLKQSMYLSVRGFLIRECIYISHHAGATLISPSDTHSTHNDNLFQGTLLFTLHGGGALLACLGELWVGVTESARFLKSNENFDEREARHTGDINCNYILT